MTADMVYDVFILSVILSAVTRFGLLMSAEKPPSVRRIAGQIILHGMIGGAIGVGAFEYVESRVPEGRVIIASVLYGGAILTLELIKTFAKQLIAGMGYEQRASKHDPED